MAFSDFGKNRKYYHSLTVQVVCNTEQKILSVVAKFRGSSHDSYILAQSALAQQFTEGKYSEGWLLGDAGYACKSWLLIPLAVPRTAAEVRYPEEHVRTRSVIKRTFVS
ncbi:putative nuclease HARBI1 [Rhinatrema bivittatum]|uniref:putative nuclease HARBI1 n=1 Tax=Rhinatrema bivittatum TaxID=194408 RepID=UPI0011281CC8|nr:putative nuclease HARBI1 [Rhinatrema bivittatum]XP_029466495.1 putative nuclease HARBI1 [Rhinatrema bivittatum]